MCDPLTLGLAAAATVGGKLISNNESVSAANRDAAARNAVLKDTLAREQGFADQNAGQLNSNIAHYAPGAQDTQLADAQAARTATSTGNITSANPNDVPISADAPPAVRGEIAKRMLAVHDGVVNRAQLSGKLGGFGDTWLKNNLNTAEADRNIGVSNNFAAGEKAILAPQQDAAAASVYKPPSIWGPALTAAGSLAAGAAGAGKGIGNLFPKTAPNLSFYAPSDI